MLTKRGPFFWGATQEPDDFTNFTVSCFHVALSESSDAVLMSNITCHIPACELCELRCGVSLAPAQSVTVCACHSTVMHTHDMSENL